MPQIYQQTDQIFLQINDHMYVCIYILYVYKNVCMFVSIRFYSVLYLLVACSFNKCFFNVSFFLFAWCYQYKISNKDMISLLLFFFFADMIQKKLFNGETKT